MIKTHCDKCDRVIDGQYYEIRGRNTNSIADCLIFSESRYRQICSECFNKIMEAEHEVE